MAITSSIGYGGTVQEDNIPQWQQSFGCKYGVIGAGDWKVTIKPGVDRTLIVAPGVGFGHTVIDLNDATEETVQLGTLATPGASRWDMVVAHRGWAGPGGLTEFDHVVGGASQLAAFASRDQTPGDVDDQPLALVEVLGGVGGGTLGRVIDLRVWAGNGGLVAADELALQYMDEVGTSVLIGGDRYDRIVDGSFNPVWRKTLQAASPISLFGAGGALSPAAAPAGAAFLIQAGTAVNTTDGSGYALITFPTPFPNGLLTVLLTNGDSNVDRAASGEVITMSVAGAPKGAGSKTDVWYAVLRPRATWPALNTGGLRHRVNWIAIGW